MKATGWKQMTLAARLAVSQATISKWLKGGQTPIKAQWDNVLELIAKDPKLIHLRHKTTLSGTLWIVGVIGPGAEIDPTFNPKKSTGLYSVSVPFPVPEAMIGLVVEGDSMWPKYERGDVIMVRREQMRQTTAYVGQLAAVQTADGKQYLKRILAGSSPDLFRLDSFNGSPTMDVSLTWIGEYAGAVPAAQVFEVEGKKGRNGARSERRAAK